MPTADHIERNGRVTSNAARKRQASFRQRMADAGMVQVTGWVHIHQASEAMQVLRRLKENDELRPGPLRHTATNRFVSLESEDE